MFYYIKDLVIVSISETKIKIDKTISEIKLEKVFENPFFENGKIIEYNESQKYIQEKELEEIKEQEKLEKEKQENQIIEPTDKEIIISEYKTNLNNIKETTAEINEVEATKQYFPGIAEKRLVILTEKRTTLREANGKIVAEGVEKYGEEILNQI